MQQKNNPDGADGAERKEAHPAPLQGAQAALTGAAPDQGSAPGQAAAFGGAGVPPSFAAAPGAENAHWRPFVEFTGTGKDLFGILLRNFILTLLTLGIYSFWGKTRKREYLWSRTQVLGSPLIYTGTGKELFISFLIVAPGLLVLSLILSALAQTAFAAFGILLFYLGLLYFWQFASYRALRYRLTRTRWRGIRGNLGGSALAYAWRGALYWLAIFCSFGLLLPWASARMADLKLNKVWFGDRQLAFSGPARELYRAYCITVAAIMFSFTALAGVLYTLMMSVMPLYGSSSDHNMLFVAGVIVFYLLLLIVIGLCGSFYHAAYFRWLVGHMRFGELRPRSTLTGAQFFFVVLGNIGIALATLGLGLAWIIVRTARVHLNSLDYTGDPQLALLLQDDQAAPKRGEGLLEALDMDIGF